MYLFHGVILAIARRLTHVGVGPQSVTGTRHLFWIDLPVVIAFSWLSFVVVESPVIEWSKRKASQIKRGAPSVQDVEVSANLT
jgi:peptidoglycan/LPS O-acetylase OafA/YrhL